MKSSMGFTRWLAALAAIGIVAGCLSTARADIAYAYAEQMVNGITVTGAGLTNGAMSGTATTNSAVANGIGVATNSPTDALQAYVGALPPSPQNYYSKYSAAGGGPQAGDFSRGDSVVSGATLFAAPGMNTSNVAESFLSTGGSGTGLFTASGSWTLSGTFNAPSTTSITVSFNYSNDILDFVTGPTASAQSSFKVTLSIKDQHGHEVDATPTQLNTALSAPPFGPEIITSGSGSAVLSLATLTANDNFSLSITGTELTSVQLSAVPEPGPMALAGLGGVITLTLGALRRRARKA